MYIFMIVEFYNYVIIKANYNNFKITIKNPRKIKYFYYKKLNNYISKYFNN